MYTLPYRFLRMDPALMSWKMFSLSLNVRFMKKAPPLCRLQHLRNQSSSVSPERCEYMVVSTVLRAIFMVSMVSVRVPI